MDSYFSKINRSRSTDEKLILVNLALMFCSCYISPFAIGLSAIYLVLSRKRRQRFTLVPNLFWLGVWAGLTTVTGLMYRNLLGVACGLIFFLFILFGMYAWTIMTDKLAGQIIRLAAIMSIAAFAIAVVQKLMGIDRTPATFFNPNFYAFACEVVFILCVSALFSRKTGPLLYSLALAANLGGILLSGCRSAWLAVLGGVLVFLICTGKYKACGISLSFAAVCGIVLLLKPDLIPRSDDFGTTVTLRQMIWSAGYQAFLKHPLFGEGFLSYRFATVGMGRAHMSHGTVIAHAHNILLDSLINFGLVGTAIALLFLVPAVVKWVKRRRHNPAGAIAVAIFTAMLIHGITDVPVLGYQTGSLTMLLLALSGAVKSSGDDRRVWLPKFMRRKIG